MVCKSPTNDQSVLNQMSLFFSHLFGKNEDVVKHPLPRCEERGTFSPLLLGVDVRLQILPPPWAPMPTFHFQASHLEKVNLLSSAPKSPMASRGLRVCAQALNSQWRCCLSHGLFLKTSQCVRWVFSLQGAG